MSEKIEGKTNEDNNEDIISKIINFAFEDPARFFYWFLIVVAIIIRLLLGMQNRGLYHPDELFQSLEPAHYQAFGFGHLPPEFQNSYPNETYYAKSRSWLFPLIFSLIMRVDETLGLSYYNFTLPLISFITVVNSVLLMFAVKYLVKVYTGSELSSKFASLIIAYWWRIIHLSMRIFTNTFFLALLIFSVARTIKIVREDKGIKFYDGLQLIVGMGLVTYIRVDLGIIIFFFALTELIQFSQKRVIIKKSTLIIYGKILAYGFIGWVIGMTVDYNIYESNGIGDLYQVPRNWFFFNFVENKSEIFGVSPFGYYYRNLIEFDGLLNFLYLTIVTIVLSLLLQYYNSKDSNDEDLVTNKLKESLNTMRAELILIIRFGIVVLLSWVLYETPFGAGMEFWKAYSHKEIRFIASAYVILLAYFGITLIHLVNVIQHIFTFNVNTREKLKLEYNPQKTLREVRIGGIIILFMLLVTMTYSNSNRYPSETFDDTNAALKFVGENGKNITGVSIVLIWFYSGMYTYLHQDVPIYFVNNAQNNFELRYVIIFAGSNYLIVPRFQYSVNPKLSQYIMENGWTFIQVIDNSVEIYRLV